MHCCWKIWHCEKSPIQFLNSTFQSPRSHPVHCWVLSESWTRKVLEYFRSNRCEMRYQSSHPGAGSSVEMCRYTSALYACVCLRYVSLFLLFVWIVTFTEWWWWWSQVYLPPPPQGYRYEKRSVHSKAEVISCSRAKSHSLFTVHGDGEHDN